MCVRVFCFWSVSVCYFVLFFSFGIRDRSLAWPSLPNSIRMCSLCLWPLLVKQQCQCGMFSELGGGIVGVGRAVQRQWGLPLNNHCSFSICTKKKDISNWNFYICPPSCLQPTVMLQMIKPVEKSCFWLYVYWNKGKTSSNHPLINVHWCALHPWLILVVYALFFLPWTSVGVITRGPDFGWSSLEIVTWEDWCHAKCEALALVGLAKRLKRVWNDELNSVTFVHTYKADKSTHSALFHRLSEKHDHMFFFTGAGNFSSVCKPKSCVSLVILLGAHKHVSRNVKPFP